MMIIMTVIKVDVYLALILRSPLAFYNPQRRPSRKRGNEGANINLRRLSLNQTLTHLLLPPHTFYSAWTRRPFGPYCNL